MPAASAISSGYRNMAPGAAAGSNQGPATLISAGDGRCAEPPNSRSRSPAVSPIRRKIRPRKLVTWLRTREHLNHNSPDNP